jgi:hypothetical protein
MNWKGSGRKWSRTNLRYYSGICLKELRKSMEIAARIFGVPMEIRTSHPQIHERRLSDLASLFSTTVKSFGGDNTAVDISE